MFMPLVDHPLLILVSGSFDELAVDEERAGPDGGDQVGRVDHPLPVLAGSIQNEGHGHAGRPAVGALGYLVRSLR